MVSLDVLCERGMVNYMIVHVCSAEDKDGIVVRVLLLADIGAVGLDVRSVVEGIIVFTHQADALHPLPGFLGPFGICLVLGIARKSSAKVEKAPVCDCVLIIVTDVGEGHLPTQSTTTDVVVPALRCGHFVEDSLGEGQPLGLVLGWIREVVLGGSHGGHAPEALIIVSHGDGIVGGHEVLVGADLEEHSLLDEVVVRVVAGEEPVVNQSPPHGTAFPPVIVSFVLRRRARENAWYLTRLVAVVVLEEVPCDGGSRLADVVWKVSNGGGIARRCSHPEYRWHKATVGRRLFPEGRPQRPVLTTTAS